MPPTRLYSVTTITKALSSEALTYWAVNTTVDYAVRKRKAWIPLADDDEAKAIANLRRVRFDVSSDAAFRGTDLHRYAESYVKGTPMPALEDEAHAPYAAAWLDFLRDFSPRFHLAEAPVYNLTYSYAGTLDAVVEIGGKLYVLDYKTTDKPEGGPPYGDTALQLAAYGHAEYVGLGEPNRANVNGRRYYSFDEEKTERAPMLEVSGGLVLVVRPGTYNLHPVRIDEEVFDAFLSVREAFRWQVDTSKRVLGPSLAPLNPKEQ